MRFHGKLDILHGIPAISVEYSIEISMDSNSVDVMEESMDGMGLHGIFHGAP